MYVCMYVCVCVFIDTTMGILLSTFQPFKTPWMFFSSGGRGRQTLQHQHSDANDPTVEASEGGALRWTTAGESQAGAAAAAPHTAQESHGNARTAGSSGDMGRKMKAWLNTCEDPKCIGKIISLTWWRGLNTEKDIKGDEDLCSSVHVCDCMCIYLYMYIYTLNHFRDTEIKHPFASAFFGYYFARTLFWPKKLTCSLMTHLWWSVPSLVLGVMLDLA